MTPLIAPDAHGLAACLALGVVLGFVAAVALALAVAWLTGGDEESP